LPRGAPAGVGSAAPGDVRIATTGAERVVRSLVADGDRRRVRRLQESEARGDRRSAMRAEPVYGNDRWPTRESV
jgi:hypothetical protein